MQIAWFGMILGLLLIAAKYGSFWLLTSKKNKETGEMEQRIVKKWILFGEKSGIRDRIHESTLLLFTVDIIGGWAGIHILGAMGGGVIATVGIATYTIACMAMLTSQFFFKWVEGKVPWIGKTIKFLTNTKEEKKYSWQETSC